MSTNDQTFLEELLGYQLGICEEHERWEVESRLGTSADAKRKIESLQQVLRPLSTYEVPPPQALVPSILSRVEQTKSIFTFPAKGKVAAEATEHGGGRPLLTLRELLSLAAAIVLFVGVFVPGYQAARNNAAKGLCLNQMRVLGDALGSYVESNAGMLPYSSASMSSTSSDRSTTSLLQASRHLQVLQQGKYLPGQRILSCPGSSNRCDNLTYSVQFYVVPPSIQQLPRQVPFISDPNPMVVNGRYLPVDALRNSDAHGGNAGQMVLRLDGSAGWYDRPTVGVDGDDIFRADDPTSYRREPARAFSDAWLTP